MLSEQRAGALHERTRDVEERLRGKDTALAQSKQQFAQLTTDFRYNLKLLEDRDAELERLDASVAAHRAAAEKAEAALAQQRASLNERDAELRRERTRVAELEAYHRCVAVTVTAHGASATYTLNVEPVTLNPNP